MFNQTMKLDHAHRRLKRCRDREARAAQLYHRRVRESEKAAAQCRSIERRTAALNIEQTINAALSLWDVRSVGK